jgi:hypothetical protein
VTDSIQAMLGQAAEFFGPSIDMTQVSLRSTSISLGRRPWTADNVIRFHASTPLGAADMATLVHELAHVWQYQNGNLQLLHGLAEQTERALGKDPYDYGGAGGVRAAVETGAGLQTFNNESQASIVEDYWSSLHGATAGRTGDEFTEVYVEDLRTLVAGAGIGKRPPAGASPIETVAGGVVNVAVSGLESIAGVVGDYLARRRT